MADAYFTKSKRIEDIHQFGSVLRIHVHEKIDIARESRKSMQCYCIPTDDEVINPVSFE